jgi:hypothetical protein
MGRPRGSKTKRPDESPVGAAAAESGTVAGQVAGAESLSDLASQEKQARAESESRPKRESRSKQKEREQQQQTEQTAREVSLVAGAFLGFAAARMPNPIPPTAAEIELIGGALYRVTLKYAPSFVDFAPELALISGLGMFILPRVINQDDTDDAENTRHSPGARTNGERENDTGEKSDSPVEAGDSA